MNCGTQGCFTAFKEDDGKRQDHLVTSDSPNSITITKKSDDFLSDTDTGTFPKTCTCDDTDNGFGCPFLVGTFTCDTTFCGKSKVKISRDGATGQYSFDDVDSTDP